MSKALKSTLRTIEIIGMICVLLIAYNMLNARFKPIIPDEEFAFSPTPQNSQKGNIEGVYYHQASSAMEILDELSCKFERWDDCTSYHLLRFYDDGTVVSISIGTDDGIRSEDLPNLEKWFHRDDKELSQGQYFVSGKIIWFSTTAYYDEDNQDDWHVTVDSSGIVLGNTILLDSYSHFNGFSLGNAIYRKLSNGN